VEKKGEGRRRSACPRTRRLIPLFSFALPPRRGRKKEREGGKGRDPLTSNHHCAVRNRGGRRGKKVFLRHSLLSYTIATLYRKKKGKKRKKKRERGPCPRMTSDFQTFYLFHLPISPRGEGEVFRKEERIHRLLLAFLRLDASEIFRRKGGGERGMGGGGGKRGIGYLITTPNFSIARISPGGERGGKKRNFGGGEGKEALSLFLS